MTFGNLKSAILCVALAACAAEEPPRPDVACRGPLATAHGGNLLGNPGFEATDGGPWYAKASWETRFSLSRRRALSGERSARLSVRSATAPRARAHVYGVVQELCPAAFPDVVRGHYFVERWEQGTPRQYLQVVAIVWDAENRPGSLGDVRNHQIRYILAGSSEQPTAIQNARYRMLSTQTPAQGRWVAFELPLRADFAELWGEVPRSFERLELFFEARYDGRSREDPASAADVFYDDLYAGPADDRSAAVTSGDPGA